MATPTRTIEVIASVNVEDHVKWINAHRHSNHNKRIFPSHVIILDFKFINSSMPLEPYHIVSLACLIHQYQEKGYRIIVKNLQQEVATFLESFNFQVFCREGYELNFIPDPTDRSLLPLCRISPLAISTYPLIAQKYFESYALEGKDLFALGNSLAELMNNIADHSKSKIPGFTFTKFHTQEEIIITSVCDFGIGIPHTINTTLTKTGSPIMTDSDAIEKSLELGFSSKSIPNNQGRGLNLVQNHIKSLGGHLMIISGRGTYQIDLDGKVKKQEINETFHGSLFVVAIKTDKLLHKEEEVTDELILLNEH